MTRWNLYALAVALAVIAMPARGAIIFAMGVVTAAQGSTGSIEVDVENTGPDSVTIAGFNFAIAANSAIDFIGAGFNTSASYIFAGDSFDQINSLALNFSPVCPGCSLSASDISNSGIGDTLGAGQTAGLGLVTFDVSPVAAPGPVSVSFFTDPADADLSDPSGNSIPIDSFVNGTIHVSSATPEPSVAAMLLAVLIGLWGWRLVRNAIQLVRRRNRLRHQNNPCAFHDGAEAFVSGC